MTKKTNALNMIMILTVVFTTFMVLGGDPLWFYEPMSLLFVLILSVPPVLLTFGVKNFISFHKEAFSKNELSKIETQRAINCFKSLRMNLICAGVLGTVLGLITMLGNLRDTSHMGPALATALLTLFYAFLLQSIWVNPILTQWHNKE